MPEGDGYGKHRSDDDKQVKSHLYHDHSGRLAIYYTSEDYSDLDDDWSGARGNHGSGCTCHKRTGRQEG